MTILSTSPPAVRPRFAVPRYASWQEAMKDAVRDPDELVPAVGLAGGIGGGGQAAARQFPLFVPRGFVARMRPGDPADPLLRQVLPLADELADVPGFVADPVGDDAATRQPGLLQKYEGRVLLVTTGTCAVHCRYCFRRHFPYDESPRSLADWQPALDEIAGDTIDPRSDPQRRRSADDRRSRRWPSWSTNWRRFRICGGCGSTRGCRS